MVKDVRIFDLKREGDEPKPVGLLVESTSPRQLASQQRHFMKTMIPQRHSEFRMPPTKNGTHISLAMAYTTDAAQHLLEAFESEQLEGAVIELNSVKPSRVNIPK